MSTGIKELSQCKKKSFVLKLFKLLILSTLLLITIQPFAPAQSQETTVPVEKPISFEDVRETTKPVTDVILYPFYLLARFLDYLITHPAAAILFSALVGALFTYLAILSQKQTVRLRETFEMLNRDNWDEDVFNARRTFSTIRYELEKDPTKHITKYFNPYKPSPNLSDNKKEKKRDYTQYINRQIAIETIMNDYENLALAVRYNIIDELYLFRWMRGAFLQDYQALMPVILERRSKGKRPLAYIEFEGLANSWTISRSYRTGNKLKQTHRISRYS